MLAALRKLTAFKDLLFLENYEDCSKCREDKYVPCPGARCHFHRHNQKALRITAPMEVRSQEFCEPFATENEGLNWLLVLGLVLGEALQQSAKEFGLHFFVLMHRIDLGKFLAHMKEAALAFVRKEFNEVPKTSVPETIVTPATCAEELTPNEIALPEVQTEPSVWDQVTEPLKVRVSEQNFEIWLSSVRFVTAQEKIVLGCPNTFFQEYLSDHYKDVIKEELQKLGERRDVVFEVIENPQPTEPPKEVAPQEILPKEEFSSPVLSKIARRQESRRELADQCTTRLHGKFEFVVVKYSDDLKLLLAKEAEEDRLEALREQAAKKEAWLDQQAKRSHYWSDDKATPKSLRNLAQQMERNDLKGTHKPKRE